MDKALVSIIVPIFNTAEYVEECIQSILSQSYKNIELILVNDGSTDGSGEICKKYECLPNVQYIEIENAGVQVARKKGVEVSTGEWIMFVDSDDYLLKDCVLELLSVSKDVDIVLGCSTRSKELEDASDYYDREDYLYGFYCRQFSPAPWAKLFRTELFRKCELAFAYNYPRRQDFLMNLALARTNDKKIAVWRKPVYFYRIRMNSATHRLYFDLDTFYDFCHIADTIVANGLPEDKKRHAMIVLRLNYYKRYLKHNDFHGNKSHPFVREIIRLMNEDRAICLSDRLLLSVSNKRAIKTCLFLNKFIVRIENPSIIIRDFKRLHLYILGIWMRK
jgi:glycosyltransferase involved in cell wall biosynthesis